MINVPQTSWSSPDEMYRDVIRVIASTIEGEPNLIANLANTAAIVGHTIPDINWAGFYLMDGGELVLAPFWGKPACIRIAVGKGVCGTAAERRETVIVDDVHAFPGHIACDAASRSEIVVPLLRNNTLVGVLDVDSPLPSRFSEVDRWGLEQIAGLLFPAS